MNRYLLLTVLAMAGAVPLSAQTDAIQQWCQTGGVQVATQGLKSTTTVQQSYPRCRVTVFYTGTTTLATIYKDKLNTPLANPFTANSDGSWLFFALDGQGYDVTMDMGTAPNVFLLPFTLTDLKVGTGGGGGQTILQFNGVPTTPVSPVNFIDTASCTWNLTGNVAGVSCSGGGSGSTPAWPIFFYPMTQSANSQIFVGHPIGGANITVPSSCPGSKALTYAASTGGSAPVATGTSAWTFQDFTTSTTLCTFTWSASGSVAVVTGSGGVIAAGDSVGFVGAATPDATLSNVGAVINGTVSGGGSGGGPSLLTNGVLNSSQTLLNIINGSFNGVTLGFSNTSGGVVQPIFTGTLNNAGITNPTMTINGVTCTLGGSCTVGGGGGSPGGTSGQIQYNNSGSFGGFTVNGDLAINTSTGLSTVSSSAGVPFGTLAFANAATPPPWGTGTPNTGAFSTLKVGSLNGCGFYTAGVLSAAGSCGSNPPWSTIQNPAGNLALTMAANTTTFTFNATTGSGVDLFKLTDTASNTGTGALMHLTTASGSAAKPWQADANGKGFYIDPATGAMTGTGFGSVAGQFGLPAGTYAGGTAGYAVFTSDATSGFAEVDENNTGRSRICTAANSICGGGTTTNALTMNNGGSGATSGTTFDGSVARTISYNTLGAAPLASPTFTGTPAAPTAAPGTNTTQLATTAFVQAAGGGGYPTPVTVTIAAGSPAIEADLTSCISSSYKDYEIRVRDVVVTTTNLSLLIQFSGNNGSTYDTGTNYNWARALNGVNTNSSGGTNGQTSQNGIIVSLNDFAATPYAETGRLTLYDPLSTVNYKQVTGQYNILGSTSTVYGENIFGFYGVTSAVNALRFYIDGSNTFSGSFTCQPLPQ